MLSLQWSSFIESNTRDDRLLNLLVRTVNSSDCVDEMDEISDSVEV